MWDIAADDLGWKNALWAPILLLLTPVVGFGVKNFLLKRDVSEEDGDDIELRDVKGENGTEDRSGSGSGGKDREVEKEQRQSACVVVSSAVSNPIIRCEERDDV